MNFKIERILRARLAVSTNANCASERAQAPSTSARNDDALSSLPHNAQRLSSPRNSAMSVIKKLFKVD